MGDGKHDPLGDTRGDRLKGGLGSSGFTATLLSLLLISLFGKEKKTEVSWPRQKWVLAFEPAAGCVGRVVRGGVAADGGDNVGVTKVEVSSSSLFLFMVLEQGKRNAFRPFQHFDVVVEPIAMPVRVENDMVDRLAGVNPQVFYSKSLIRLPEIEI
jgi:hypothetical protein